VTFVEDKSRKFEKPKERVPTPQPEDNYWNPPKYNSVIIIERNGDKSVVEDKESIKRFGKRERVFLS